MSRLVAPLALAFALTAVPAAYADDTHPEGAYNGAKPGVRPGADTGKPQKKPPTGTLSWIGFEAKDSGATVWFQAAGTFDVTQHVEGTTLVVNLTGLRKMVRNTRRPIETRFFDNPLARISAKAVKAKRGRKGKAGHGAGIEVRIQFRNPKDAKEGSLRTATEADGLFYAYLSFPPGTDLPITNDTTGPAIDPGADVER
jgi:hypothetical protein